MPRCTQVSAGGSRASVAGRAAAGPVSNLLMALFWTVMFAVILHGSVPLGSGRQFMLAMVQIGITFNILLCIFNLIPVPPLDGGRVLRGLVPETLGRRLDAIEPYGFIILIALLATGIGGSIVWPLVQQASRALYALAGASF
ncbi:MAG: site-2 protease family protein [Gammaproteobacteria bacterium PRO9]|nr:site-2 protease family protein [Gammaproteobacteria bacterium PRO9]